MATHPEQALDPTSTGRSPSAGRSEVIHEADLELLREARSGGREARSRFVERMRCIPRILAAKNRRMGRPLADDDLADLCQETFSLVWSKSHTYAGLAKLETWVARYCLLLFMNAVRKRRRRLASLQTDPQQVASPEVSAHLSLEQTQMALSRALARLNAETAGIIKLRLLERIPFEDIASRLELPVNTAKTRYYRGMERLRSLLRPVYEEGMG